jgi:putative endonuclease
VVTKAFDPHVLGRAGEELAARWYVDQGYEIAARNWRCPSGELDIVARRGRELVVCEVKTRSSAAFGSPGESVTRSRQRRLRRAASQYLADDGGRGGGRWATVRFDVAEVTGDVVTVIEGAFAD